MAVVTVCAGVIPVVYKGVSEVNVYLDGIILSYDSLEKEDDIIFHRTMNITIDQNNRGIASWFKIKGEVDINIHLYEVRMRK